MCEAAAISCAKYGAPYFGAFIQQSMVQRGSCIPQIRDKKIFLWILGKKYRETMPNFHMKLIILRVRF
ncbi:hypothetical protein HK26_12225 [Acetobacter okinawensis]|uniref:Uncharacterized protein n=1 Tax=Acetobacter okinawensis TaxID=1076594 RepID=A0A252BVJ0_9PROT|nr:hypothetical protein HK26_12225 [Acetobacter okinawensis]